ncbi:pyrroline-5-carboxylate reductase [Pseudochrobactrum sp. HB0163]|uniref:pyrroline-5-carboxylate reductase n=1 Tax=Pseudochrobactrum sp. HB0163 TaxID=3450708 RepID=UPI003F6DDD72
MSTNSVILVGCGNMGYAMLQGWLAAGKLQPDDVTVVEPAQALRERACGLGVRTLEDHKQIPASLCPRLIIIAVKPQIIQTVLPAYQAYAARATFVSVAAGIPVEKFESLLGINCAVIRCMPNTPAAIGKGMMVTFANSNVQAKDLAFAEELLQTSGRVARIATENLMDAVTAVSGSGPAYVFHFIECLTEAGIQAGLPQDIAAMLAMQTVYGAACLAQESTQSPSQLRINVTSPNGTTAAALDVLMGENRLQTLITDAVNAAKQRSAELGKS